MIRIGYDVLILTVSAVERDACLKHLADAKKITLKTHLDDEIEQVSVRAGFYGDLSVVVVCILKPDGNRVSSTLTLAGIRFSPAIIVSMGVGGGVLAEPGSVEVGDVVISNAIADHSQSVEAGTHIHYNIKSKKVRKELEPALEEIANNPAWLEGVHAPKVEPGLEISSRIIIAPISAGNVLAKGDHGPLAQAIKTQTPEVRAIDMESAAGISAASALGLPFVAVRGISDLREGKSAETDRWTQPWAMGHACAAGFHLLANLQAYILNSKAEQHSKISFVGLSDESKTAEVNRENVEALARRLLQVNQPASLAMLFPKCKPAAKQAFDKCLTIERIVTEQNGGNDIDSRSVQELLDRPERAHLVVGPPGSGKSQSFWSAAQALLNEGQIIPLYLRLGKHRNWEEVKLDIRKVSNGLTLADLINDPRICFFLDGWSEFGTESSSLEKTNLLTELAKSKIVANGKFARDTDSFFKIWNLDSLSKEQVICILKWADPQLPPLTEELETLLRLPLFLSIHILSNASESKIGAVLQKFHESVADGLPQGFTDTLAAAVAQLTLANENSYDRLAAVLRQLSQDKDFSDSNRLLRKLGTIIDSDGAASPVHDLYWDWLVGRGVLTQGFEEQALSSGRAREGVSLAIQSGEYSKLLVSEKIREQDIVFAAILENGWPARKLPVEFKYFVDKLLSDSRLVIKHRGGIAALKCGRGEYLLPAFKVLDLLIQSRIYSQEWRDAIRPDAILANVSRIEDWFGSSGSEFFWDEIAAKGGSEWLPELQDLSRRGKIDSVTACSVALAVSPTVPQWVRDQLDELLSKQPWKLKNCAKRKSNTQLATIIANDYERLVAFAQTKSGSGFCDLNDALVACADETVFDILLSKYESMSDKAREWLGYAISKKGEPWLSRFRLLGKVPHSFEAGASTEVDSQTARQWIRSGREEEGWRALISRHGASIMPKIIEALPASFAGIDHMPALHCIRYCSGTPASIIPEIVSRLGSPMMPKAMEECLAAIGSVYPEGVPTLVNLVVQNRTLPGYHLAQLLDLYTVWNRRSGLALAVISENGQSVPFPEWLANFAYERGWEPYFTDRILAKVPEVAIKLILGPLNDDLKKAEEILRWVKNIKTANSELFSYMLNHPSLATYVTEVFAGCFKEFSNDDIEKCLESASLNQHLLLSKLATDSSPKQRSAHFRFIQKLLDEPLDIHKYRYVAGMLRCYSVDAVLDLLQSLKNDSETWLWLVREVEIARGEFLIDENGELRL